MKDSTIREYPAIQSWRGLIAYAVALVVILLLTNCAAIKAEYHPETGAKIWSRHQLENGYNVGFNKETGEFHLDTCGGAVSTDRGPLEDAGADLVRGVGQLGLDAARGRLGGVLGSPAASPVGECTCSREQHIQAVIDDPSIVAEAMARR